MHLLTVARGLRLRAGVATRRLLTGLVAVLTLAGAVVATASPAAADWTHSSFTFNAGTTAGVSTADGQNGPTISGHTSVGTSAAETTTITLNAPRTYILVNRFSLGAEDTLNLVFANTTDIAFFNSFDSAVVAGRINTFIGSLDGPRGGNVWLGGLSAVQFSSTADVEVGGLLATSNRTNSTEFLSGTYNFASPFFGTPPVFIQGGASITGHGSLVAFIGPTVQQQALSAVGGEVAGTEVLYGSAETATLRLGAHATGLELLDFSPTARFFDGGQGPVLAGATSAPDVFVVGAGTGNGTIRLTGTISATGAAADGSGDVVVAAGTGVTRATGADPLQIGTTATGAYVHAFGAVDAGRRLLMSATRSVSLLEAAELSAPSVVLSAADSLYNAVGPAAVDVGPTGQWVVYALSPDFVIDPLTAPGHLDSGRPAVWGTDLANTPPSALAGNRYVFRQRPTVTVTAHDVQKPYGTTLASFAYTTTGFHLGMPGLYTADEAAAYVGAPAFVSEGAAAGARALRSGPYPIAVSTGTLSSPPGYSFRFVNGRLTVTDSTAPVVAPIVTGTLGDDGWYTDDVSVTWSVTDDESYADRGDCADVTVTSDQPATTYSCSATGPGGNATGTVTIKRDASAPGLTIAGVSGEEQYIAGAWTNEDVSITYTCDGAISGVATVPSNTVATSTGPYGATCTDTAGNSTTAPFQVNIDRTAPTVGDVAFSLADSGGTYTPGTWADEPVRYSWTCADQGGSNALNGGATGSTSASLTFRAICEDHAGNSGSSPDSDIKVDLVDPTIVAPTLTSGGNTYAAGSWTRNPVTLTWGCTDPASGPASTTGTESLSASGNLTATCTDNAGNQVSQEFAVLIDTAAPAIGGLQLTTADGQPYSSGTWTSQDVTLSWTCSDGTGQSGVATATGSATAMSTGILRALCTDVAGNSAQGEPFQANIDDTAPVLAGVPANQSVTTTGTSSPVSWATPTATDNQDTAPAIACAPASGSTFAVGTTTVTCTATDDAGNVDAESFTVTVTRQVAVAVTFRAPIDAPTVINNATAGRVVPVRISAAGVPVPTTPGTTPLATGTPQRVTCPAGARSDAVETYTSRWPTATNLFVWDANKNNWLAKVDTRGLVRNACYRVPVQYGGTITGGTATGGTEVGFFYLRTR